MIKKAEFDNIIKENLIKKIGQAAFRNDAYGCYYSDEEFKRFVDEMKSSPYDEIYRSYYCGDGGELVSHGKKPPKMASVASSSRFCYLALRDGAQGLGGDENVKFEYECRIKGISGTAPQLDAYIPNSNIYVEAKCHEIFDLHRVEMSKQYWKYLRSEENDFGFAAEEEKEVIIELSEFGLAKERSMFDVKQFICHLLGIQSKKTDEEPATLVYLFFKPIANTDEKQRQVDEVFDELQSEIKTIFNSAPIQRFITSKNIYLRAVAECSEVMEALSSENIIEIINIYE